MPALILPTRFGLLRHGKTVWNLEKRVQGRLDSPLTDQGRRSCNRWAILLAAGVIKWNRIIASPLQRAVDTAEIINRRLQVSIQVEPALREQDWGQWEGVTIRDLRARFTDEFDRQVSRGWDFCPPGGESRQAVRLRALAALHRLADRHPGENILLITHLGVIKSILYAINGRRFLPDEPNLLLPERFHTILSDRKQLVQEEINISLPDPL